MVSQCVSHLFSQTDKLHFPAANITNCNEPVTTDTKFSDEPVLGSNARAVQSLVGCNYKYIDVYGVATDHDLCHTLEENIMN